LDGTLVETDTLLESILRIFKRDPGILLWMIVWLFRGKAYLKRRVAERAGLNPAELPYCREMLAFLETEHAAGTKLVLATGADEGIAQSVAAHLGIFDEVLASDGKTNLTGERKKRELVARFGVRGFRYAGNSRTDVPVWRESNDAIVFRATRSLLRRLGREGIRTERVFPLRRKTVLALFRALRIYQWPKNLLIWIPLFLSHRVTEMDLVANGMVAMLAFSLCASALYVVNDLLDLAADRAHPRKCKRPFASGALPIWLGAVLAPSLAAAAILLSLALPSQFLFILLLYAALSSAYSFMFKEVPMLDVCLLGGLYVVRIFAGGSAMGVVISSWTFGYSMFVFLSLALLKRYVELLMLNANKKTAAHGRGYVVGDASILGGFGAACGCVAALVLALYIESDEVRLLYQRPQWLWLLCGLHLYWISRAWLLAHRGEMHHDPVLFALRDRTSYWAGLAAVAIVLAAT
jgi:4-hydroxybenzoate polyprenyltransferase